MIPGSTCFALAAEIVLLVTSAAGFGTWFSGTQLSMPLRISTLHVPSPAERGASVALRCGYELGEEALYAVKWYKDMGEFFRYVPGSEQPFKSIPQPGVDVDVTRSDETTVFLRNLSMDSYGNYTCQVSTDRPHFRCVQSTRPLEVVVPPSDGPILTEERSEYELGDNVSILCNSGKARPAPHLQWYINDQLAPSPSGQEVVVHDDHLESSRLQLQFLLRPEVFRAGKVRLRCVATHLRAAEAVTEIRTSTTSTGASHSHAVWIFLSQLAVVLLISNELSWDSAR